MLARDKRSNPRATAVADEFPLPPLTRRNFGIATSTCFASASNAGCSFAGYARRCVICLKFLQVAETVSGQGDRFDLDKPFG